MPSRSGARVRVICVIACVCVARGVEAGQEPLAAARSHYNDGRYLESIALAESLWREEGRPAAGVVLARARLERFRETGDAEQLAEARRMLGRMDPAELTAAEAVEWEIGLASALFLEGRFGPAAELLDRLLREPDILPTEMRDRVLEWWAAAIDRTGSAQTPAARERTYGALITRLEAELARNPASGSAPYWLAAAARAAGALDRAWSAAVAGWVRAPRAGAARDRLRADLERLTLQAIVPELAARRTGQGPDSPDTVNAMAELAAEWERITAAWRGR